MAVRDVIFGASSRWLFEGPENDVVISSRVRLARNLEDIPFPHLMNEDQASRVLHGVRLAATTPEVYRELGPMEFVMLEELSPLERQILVEKHLVSPQFVQEPRYRAVVVSEDEAVSIMVNEEDHLRIQVILPGLQLEEAYRLAEKTDDLLEGTLNFAFDERRGYLTACPTNVGTGLRASVMVHLPALVLTNQIGNVINAVTKLGMAVRGFYGEGTEALGNLFQISNQVTLGPSEEEIISNLLGVTRQIIAQERSTREYLYRENRQAVEDRVWRSYGLLKHARIITSEETMRLLSDVRLGVALGVVPGLTQRQINELMVITRPAFLQKVHGGEMNPYERDLLRAQVIREKLI
ncbi:MAG: protein arginine kinase [Eubacteriales bacterium]|nr:protein arginine kinase [Eubacteriales bacterium]MDN5364309.1 protein arginine kinase [Eubacteriales bacterium]